MSTFGREAVRLALARHPSTPRMHSAAVPSYVNPVHGEYLADPFVWSGDGRYYAIGTGAREAAGHVTSANEATVFPLLESRDLLHWSVAGAALVRPDPALGDAFWAPEVASDGRRWYLYYSVGHGDRAHQLRVAVSDAPRGPYRDVGALTALDEVPFAIDPHPFRDEDGAWYLFHARDFLDEDGETRAGTALVVARLRHMTTLEPRTITVARARCEWQRFAAGRTMYGRVFDWHTLEGPCVVRHAGRYFCLYSGGCWQNDTYGVDYAVADAVMGPWHDRGADAGPRVLRTVPERVLGPGHCSVVLAPDRRTRVLAYHAWDAAMTQRRLCIDPLEFGADGPRCAGPSWTTRAAPWAVGS